MQDSPIQIGSISLQGFEIPTSVRFGGRQRLAIHNLSGGRRIVERLGPDDGEVVFQGTFSGPNAEARVRVFDDLRLSGAIVWLTWETFRRRVVIKNFVAEYHSPWWIPYKVSCVVAHQAGVTSAQTSTVLALMSADLGSALSAVAGSALSFDSLKTTLFSANATTSGTLNQVQAVMAVGKALATIDSQIMLQSEVTTTPIEQNADPDSLSQTLVAAVRGAGLLAAAVNARSYVGRIGKSLISAGN